MKGRSPTRKTTTPSLSQKLLVQMVGLIGVIALMVTSFPSFVVVASAQSDNNAGASPKKADIICSQAIMQQQENPHRALPSFCRDVVVEPECTLEITTDQETYGPGDVVTITVTNTGDETLMFPDSILGLQIVNLDTGAVFPLEALQVITELAPGESQTFQFTYEDIVNEIGSGTIEASVSGDGCSASTTFTLAPRSSA
jgi:hypothetical protein